MGTDPNEISSDQVLSLAGKPVQDLSFADRLNLLWTAVRPRADEDPQAWRKAEAATRGGKLEELDAQGRPQYTNTFVAQQLHERFGVQITPSYLGKLRHSDKINPGLPVLKALAQFFKIDTAFLLPVTTQTDRDTIAGIRDDLLSWISRSGSAATASMSEDGMTIELRLPGVTTTDEAQRQVAMALALWLDEQRKRESGTG